MRVRSFPIALSRLERRGGFGHWLLFRGRKSFTTKSSVSEDVDHLLCGADRPLTKKVCAGKSWPPNPLPSGTVVVVGSLLR